MAGYTYKGRDRRLILKGMKVLQTIIARDVKALNTSKRTTQLSTRELILDNDNTAGGLLYAANQIIDALLADSQAPFA